MDQTTLIATVVPLGASLLLCSSLFIAFLFFPFMRRRMINRIVMWQCLVDCVWLGIATGLLYGNQCWSYLSDCLLFTASCGWNVSMAVQIYCMSLGLEPRTERWDLYYHAFVWSCATLAFGCIYAFSGGAFEEVTVDICEPRKGYAQMVDILWIVDVSITTFIGAIVYAIVSINPCFDSRGKRNKSGSNKPLKTLRVASVNTPGGVGDETNDAADDSEKDAEQANALTPLLASTFAERKQAVPKNGRFLLVYLLLWMPRTVWFIMDLLHADMPDWFNTLSNACVAAVGAGNVIIFGTMPPEKVFYHGWQVIAHKWRRFWRQCCATDFPDVESKQRGTNIWRKATKPRSKQASLDHSPPPNRRLHPDISDELRRMRTVNWLVDPNLITRTTVLGQGATSVVFAGRYKGRDVAIKKMRNMGVEEALQLMQEAKLWSHLNHPHVLPFLGLFVEAPHCLHFVSPRCPSSLAKQIETTPPPEYLQRIRWAHEVAEAMAYLHSRKVLHRDLKPENVLVDEDNRSLVCDFGCAVVFQQNEARLSDVFGSAEYLAPEVLAPAGLNLAGGVTYTSKIDVYAFGIMLWRIATCERLYPGFTRRSQIYRAVVRQKLRPTVPPNSGVFGQLMQRCWSDEPHARPEFAKLATELAQLLSDLQR